MEILYSQRGDYLILFPWEERKRGLASSWPFSEYYCLIMETNWKKKKRLKQRVLHPVYSFTTSFSHYWTLFWIIRRDVKVQGIQVKMWSNWDISSRNAKQCTSMEDGLTVSSKAKERPTIQPSIHASGYLASWPEKLCSHKNLHMNFCSMNLTIFQIWPYDNTSLNGIQKKDI